MVEKEENIRTMKKKPCPIFFQPGGRRSQCVPEHHFPRQESVVPLLCDILGETLRPFFGHLCPGPGGGGRLDGIVGRGSWRPQNVGQKALGRRAASVLFKKPGQQWPLAPNFILDTYGKLVFKSCAQSERIDGCEWHSTRGSFCSFNVDRIINGFLPSESKAGRIRK